MTDTFVRNYSPLSEKQKQDMDWIKHKAEELLNAFECAINPDPRMMSIAKTNLEQAVMWAVKGVTNPPVPKE
jgi:hypothetical protein